MPPKDPTFDRVPDRARTAARTFSQKVRATVAADIDPGLRKSLLAQQRPTQKMLKVGKVRSAAEEGQISKEREQQLANKIGQKIRARMVEKY